MTTGNTIHSQFEVLEMGDFIEESHELEFIIVPPQSEVKKGRSQEALKKEMSKSKQQRMTYPHF